MLIGTGALCGLEGVEGVWRVGFSVREGGKFMSPCNHQVLNSTIRSCYFATSIWQEAHSFSEQGGRRMARAESERILKKLQKQFGRMYLGQRKKRGRTFKKAPNT